MIVENYNLRRMIIMVKIIERRLCLLIITSNQSGLRVMYSPIKKVERRGLLYSTLIW